MKVYHSTNVILVALSLVATASADPRAPKLWVQGPTSPAMLLELIGDDPRIRPIIRVNVPINGQIPWANCGDPLFPDTRDPRIAGCVVADAAKLLTTGRQPIFQPGQEPSY